MKNLAKIIGVFLLALSIQTASAQTVSKKTDKDHNAKVTVTDKDGKRIDIEKWAEDFGNNLGNSIEKFVDDLMDGKDTNFNFDSDGRGFGDTIENMVKNMEIDLEDVSPADFADGEMNDRDGQEILDDIAKKHGSEVKMIEKMKIKILGDKGVKLDMNVRLKNGKTVQESRIIKD